MPHLIHFLPPVNPTPANARTIPRRGPTPSPSDLLLHRRAGRGPLRPPPPSSTPVSRHPVTRRRPTSHRPAPSRHPSPPREATSQPPLSDARLPGGQSPPPHPIAPPRTSLSRAVATSSGARSERQAPLWQMRIATKMDRSSPTPRCPRHESGGRRSPLWDVVAPVDDGRPTDPAICASPSLPPPLLPPQTAATTTTPVQFRTGFFCFSFSILDVQSTIIVHLIFF